MPTAQVGDNKTGFNQTYSYLGMANAGTLSADAVEAFKEEVMTAFGCASDGYDANSGNIMAEALGLALEGNSTLRATANRRALLARKTGERIVKVIDNVITPKSVVTEEALTAWLAVDLALGSSSASILNLLAIAKTIGLKKFNLDFISEFGKKIPHYAFLSSRTQFFMENFAAEGGVYGLIAEMSRAGLISAKYGVYTGQPMQSLVKSSSYAASVVAKRSPLRVINGNIAEGGAVSFLNEVSVFSGKAKVFDSQEAAFEAIVNREISKGDALVIKNEGPSSCPGMREVRLPLALLAGLNLDKEVAVITDGRIQNISRGIAVGNITPETGKDGGALHLLQNNDPITIDLSKGRIAVDVPSKELSKRGRVADRKKQETEGYLERYAVAASPASEGALGK